MTIADLALLRDPVVVSLQLLLATRGYPPGPIDGIRGPKTEAALERAREARHGGALPVVEWLRAQPTVRVELPRVSTPVAPAAMREALKFGHAAAFDVYPSTNVLRMGCAQMGVEHGLDGHAVHTFNLGNIMATKSWRGPWFRMTAEEERSFRAQGVRVPVKSTWRGYADAPEGAASYWEMMRKSFGAALATFAKGDAAATAHALKLSGYYTAYEKDYARLLAACWRAVG